MSAVLQATSRPRYERWAGVFAGILLASFILFESPLSGTSMNPARTFGSALPAGVWSGWWIYLGAPFAGMLAAAELHRTFTRGARGGCAKLRHTDCRHCIFCGEGKPDEA
jgi:aquaporin Z